MLRLMVIPGGFNVGAFVWLIWADGSIAHTFGYFENAVEARAEARYQAERLGVEVVL